jgi:hypothetical protein
MAVLLSRQYTSHFYRSGKLLQSKVFSVLKFLKKSDSKAEKVVSEKEKLSHYYLKFIQFYYIPRSELWHKICVSVHKYNFLM